MDFGKSNRVPNGNIYDFDLNKPWMGEDEEEEKLDLMNTTENESSPPTVLIGMNTTTPQNDDDTDNMNKSRDNEVHKSTSSSDDRPRRHFPERHYVTSILSGPHVHGSAARGKKLEGRGRPRHYHRRGGGVLVHSDANRYCTNYYCRTRKTPLWRKGPLGPKTLCNACGIHYMKQVTSRGSGIATFPNVVASDDASSSHFQLKEIDIHIRCMTEHIN